MNINQNLLNKPLILKKKLDTKLYNLEYWIGNYHESTILYARTKPQCIRIANSLKTNDSRYKLGIFKYKEN